MQNIEEIKKVAKQILDKFSAALEKVEEEIAEEFFEVEKDRREEKEGISEEDREKAEDFRRRMFANAKKKDENFIYAEKKKW
jgi:mRNA-degrading endonuclease RelE of RelBE toxin-antitoxin system